MIKDKELKKKEMFQVMIESLEQKKQKEIHEIELEKQERMKYKQYLKSLEERKERLFKEKAEKEKIKDEIYK